MATYNNEDNIKWNDLATSLQDIIMRKITWNMLHPDLQSWLLDKERRIIELERWRRTKADPMLDDHEIRITQLENDIDDMKHPPGGGPNDPGFPGNDGFIKFPSGFIAQWGEIPYYRGIHKHSYKFHYFNTPFPNKAMVIAGSPVTNGRSPGDSNEFNWHLTIIDKNRFASYHDEGSCGFTWIAFGY